MINIAFCILYLATMYVLVRNSRITKERLAEVLRRLPEPPSVSGAIPRAECTRYRTSNDPQ